MSLTVAAVAFGLVFLAELPDKTALATLVLSTKYRGSWVLCGVAAAFAVHVLLALVAGSLLTLLPHRLLEGVVGVLFLGGAVMLLVQKHDGEEEDSTDGTSRKTFPRVFLAGFGLILLAEFGDLTQIMTANLAARYADPLSVGAGAFLALCAVSTLAVVGGRAVLRWVPVTLFTRVAAALMLVLAGFSCYDAVTG